MHIGPHKNVEWVIKIDPTDPKPNNKLSISITSLPNIELYVPTPLEDEGWIQLDSELEDEALDRLQDTCEKIKGECTERLISSEELSEEEKEEGVVRNLNDLGNLLNRLYQIMKKFHPKRDVPPEDL